MTQYTFLKLPDLTIGIVASPLGLAEVRLCGASDDARKILSRAWPDAAFEPNLLPKLQRQMRDYFNGVRVRFNVRIDLSKLTAFQQKVLLACGDIGYGQTMSYADLARTVCRPRSARAVGGALARNPIPLVIPCHRVIASDGSLGGFSAPQGLALKRRLLDLEARPVATSISA